MSMNLPSIEHAIAIAKTRWGAGFHLERTNNREARGPCPICHQATVDGFLVFIDGGFYCRRCRTTGWLDDDQKSRALTPQELEEIKQKKEAWDKKEKEESRIARATMAVCQDHYDYHENLTEEHRVWWETQGIDREMQDAYLLGYCPACQTDREKRPSYTIPVWDSSWTILLNIQHRIIGASAGDKYRPHMAKLGQQLFNSRLVKEGHKDLGLVEGAKKSIVMTSRGFPCCGTNGTNAFRLDWLKHFAAVESLWIGFDPDADEAADTLARKIVANSRIRVRIVSLYCKPDDFFVLKGGTDEAFKFYLRYARPIGE